MSLTNRRGIKEMSYAKVIEIMKERERISYEVGFDNGLKQAREENKISYDKLKRELKEINQ